jgi:hypothetical protein
MMMSRPHLTVLVLGIALSSIASAAAQAPPTQLDRVEQKLDTILHRLDQFQPGQVPGARSAPPSSATAPASPPAGDPAPSPAAATQGAGAQSDSTVSPGALAIVHPAPPLSSILAVPADAVGGFVYRGGPIRLDDLAALGVRYHGQAGIELQGWLRVRETGRYQLAAEFSLPPGGAIAALNCGAALWLEDRQAGEQPGELTAGPNSLTLVLGSELQPGLYKLRFWTACGRMFSLVPVTMNVLIKAPSNLNLRALTIEDVVHREG